MASIELDSFYLEVAEELPARSRDKLIAVIVRKIAFNEEPASLPAPLRAVYKALEPMLNKAAASVQNGKKGGRPKTQTETQTETQVETQTITQPITQGETQTITQQETQPVTQSITQVETQEEKNAVYIDSKDLRNTKNTEYYSDSKDTAKQEIESNNNIKNTIDTVNTRNRESIENNIINSYITPYSPPLSGESKTETETQTKTQRKNQITEIADRVVDYLNLKAGTAYRHGIAKTISFVSARLKDGFTENDFTLVIDKKCEDWNGTDYARYLRPETLFGTKFESYLNQVSQQSRNDSCSVSAYAVEPSDRLPWVPDEVYDQPDFGSIPRDTHPSHGYIEYYTPDGKYAGWEAKTQEQADKIEADYRAWIEECKRRKEAKQA